MSVSSLVGVGSGVRIASRVLAPGRSTLLLVSGALALYLLTLSRNFYGAGVGYAVEIESGDWSILFQQHKLLLHPLGRAFLQGWEMLGWRGGGLLPLQVLNALAGSLAVGFLYRACLNISGSSAVAGLAATGFALSSGMWLFSTEAAFLTPPLAASLLALWCLSATPRGEEHRVSHSVRLGLAAAPAVLLYVTNVFLFPCVAVFYLFDSHVTIARRLKRTFAFAAVALAIVIPVYVAALVGARGIHSIESLSGLGLYGGQGSGVVYGRASLANLAYGGYGFLKSLAAFPGLGLDDRTTQFLGSSTAQGKALFAGYYLAVLILASSPVLLLFQGSSSFLRSRPQAVAALACWCLLNAAFATYWIPKDARFWMPATSSWWIFAAGIIGAYGARRPLLRPRMMWVPVMVAFFSAVTAAGVVLPHMDLRRNHAYELAVSVQDRTNDGDLIVSVADDTYTAYFAHRRTISVLDRLLRAGPNRKGEVLAGIDAAVRETSASGGRTFLLGTADGSNGVDWGWLEEAGLTPADLQRFSTKPAWTIDGETVLEVLE